MIERLKQDELLCITRADIEREIAILEDDRKNAVDDAICCLTEGRYTEAIKSAVYAAQSHDAASEMRLLMLRMTVAPKDKP